MCGNGFGIRQWMNFEERDRRNLYCLEQTDNRNIDIKDAGEIPGRSEDHQRENLNCLRESLNHHEQIVIKILGIKNTASEDSEKNVTHVTRTGGRRILVGWQKAQKDYDWQLHQKQNCK